MARGLPKHLKQLWPAIDKAGLVIHERHDHHLVAWPDGRQVAILPKRAGTESGRAMKNVQAQIRRAAETGWSSRSEAVS